MATGPDWQLVLTDLPGVQRPRDKLTERMQRTVDRELGEADAAVLVLSAIQGVGPGDRFIAHTLAAASVPVLIVVNKLDAVRKRAVPEVLAAAEALDVADEIFPVSAKRGHGMEQLREALIARLPEGPFHFPPEDHTDLPLEVRLAELVREPILARTRQEVPHAIEVVIDEIDESRPDLVRVRALAWAETESQKGILIGAGGRMVREIGTAARKEMERRARTKSPSRALGARAPGLARRRVPARSTRNRLKRPATTGFARPRIISSRRFGIRREGTPPQVVCASSPDI